jgi:hypothetical protein
MSQEEVANAEALRRIREAENTGATSLDLSHLDSLYQLPRELDRLTSLRELDLSWCEGLGGDLSQLAGFELRRSFSTRGWQNHVGEILP